MNKEEWQKAVRSPERRAEREAWAGKKCPITISERSAILLLRILTEDEFPEMNYNEITELTFVLDELRPIVERVKESPLPDLPPLSA